MKALAVVTSDAKLLQMFVAATPEERVIGYAWASIAEIAVLRDLMAVVCDCRKSQAIDVGWKVARLREALAARTVIVVLIAHTDIRRGEVVAAVGSTATELVVYDSDSTVDIVRAHLSDRSQTCAAALALAALKEFVPEIAYGIVSQTVGLGMRKTSVKQLAAAVREHRSSYNRRVRRVADFTAKEVVDLSRASYAAGLLRVSARPLSDIVDLTGFTRPAYLDALLKRTLGMSMRQVRAHDGPADLGAWLRKQLPAAHKRALTLRGSW